MSLTAPPRATTTRGALGHYRSRDMTMPYFLSGDLESDRAVVFVGGLFNGMGDVPYVGLLGERLGERGWKLVQPHWTSAYTAFALTSLSTDVSDLSALVAHLRPAHNIIVLMGHSTGSQDVMQGGIMQAPVSDREHFGVADDAMSRAWRKALPRAREMVKTGRGEEIMDHQTVVEVGYPVKAYRVWSLLDPSGDDDYFSTDLPFEADGVHAHPLSTSFGRLSKPALALMSGADEFAHIPNLQSHLARWVEASQGKLSTAVVDGASHAVDDPKLQRVLCEEVLGWLDQFE